MGKRLVHFFASALRRLRGILCRISFLLFLATIALWIRTYWGYDRIELMTCRLGADSCMVEYSAALPQGHAVLERYWYHQSFGIGEPACSWGTNDPMPAALLGVGSNPNPGKCLFGFGFCRAFVQGSASNSGSDGVLLTVQYPLWAQAVLFALAPLFACRRVWLQQRKVRRAARGCCAECGYDLRATPERCPECGRRADAAKPAPIAWPRELVTFFYLTVLVAAVSVGLAAACPIWLWQQKLAVQEYDAWWRQLMHTADAGDAPSLRRLLACGPANRWRFAVQTVQTIERNGPEDVALAWVEAGADASFDDGSLLPMAVFQGYRRVAIRLLEKGAKVDARDRLTSNTALRSVAFHPKEPFDLGKLLLSRGADPNVTDRDGDTPLHIVASEASVRWRDSTPAERVRFAELLISHGADLNFKNRAGKTPLDLAKLNCPELAAYLNSQQRT
ncbi:MAG: ankyrin repeat domain-containing protein [Tepidisphaerales bacterium]